MEAPIDPTEPLFPIRPNEPLCQYFMKHGTCKFGQACKFHHPPNAVVRGGGGSLPPDRRIDGTPMILKPVGTDGSSMMLQFLPQRPDEPDCIYFLKNGRCRYGATCRYHHPINGSQQHQRRPGRPSGDPQFGNKIHVVNPGGQLPPGLMSDVTFVSLDGSQTLAPVTFVPTGDHYSPTTPNTVATEIASSVSSIGSSHDTAGTSFDMMTDGTSRANWLRARNNGSGGSLNAYGDHTILQRPPRLAPSSSDPNIARRRGASMGSSSDQGATQYDGGQSIGPMWRQTRSGSFEQLRRPHEPSSPSMRGRPPTARGPTVSRMTTQRPRQGQGDEGYAMMTSALLNMLETPEETSAEVYSEEGNYHYPNSVEDDDASRLIGGLSLESQAPTEIASNLNAQYEDSRWSPSWQEPDQTQDIIHPYIQSHASTRQDSLQYPQHHASPSSQHSADFGQYLP